jgi:beta-galactosidase
MKSYLSLFVTLILGQFLLLAQATIEKPLFGVAYYDEYMPYDRLEKDVEMMLDAGINTVRIAESTWSTVEPQDNVFDFTHIDRVLDAMHKAGIQVIVGTPTYAVPTWLVRQYPSVMATTPKGQNQYGARQKMDITDTNFRFHAERVIRKIMEHVKDHPAIIGYQVDNETKHYETSGLKVQEAFVDYIKDRFISLDSVNNAFGLDYWSNRINAWEDFPSTDGSINASLNAEFSRFQRKLVTDYLAWQVQIIKEYAKPNQFVTHNFDLNWRGYSYGIQPDVDHFEAARALDIAGVDVYHPTQDRLTGVEISLAGDLTRSMKGGQNYFVIETEAQGFPQWVPYPGQLRLQAFSHLASGANMVAYWHWHSIHNSAETYWKGLLSHDFEPNPTYLEAATIGKDLNRIGKKLANLKIKNQVAVFFSNEALSAFNSFQWIFGTTYNDVLRPYYDALYNLNVGIDWIDPTVRDLSQYKLIVVPALYAVSDEVVARLNDFVARGGHVVYTWNSGFSNEWAKVRSGKQPGGIYEAAGVTYSQFTKPEQVGLKGNFASKEKGASTIHTWMELLTPSTAQVHAWYDHPVWGDYAAITQNSYGQGSVIYVGCGTSAEITSKIMKYAVKNAGLWGQEQQLTFPLITKKGLTTSNSTLRYIFNYSVNTVKFTYPFRGGQELLSFERITQNQSLEIPAWGVFIVEEN